MRTIAILALMGCTAGICRAGERLPIGPAEFDSVLPSGVASPSVHVARLHWTGGR